MHGKVIPCYSWCSRMRTTAHKLLRTDHSTDSSALCLENVIWVEPPFPKYPELTATQSQQFCMLEVCHGIRWHVQEAHIWLQKVSVCRQCHPQSPFVLSGACRVCSAAGRVAGGLHLGHSLSSDSGGVTAAGNQEDSSCLFWWLQGEGKSEVIEKGSLFQGCFAQFMLLNVF